MATNQEKAAPPTLDYVTPHAHGLRIPYLRWVIAILLFLAAVLNYIDRNLLGLLAPTILKELNISNEQYAAVVNFFLVAYTISYLMSGRVVDKLGVRLSMALFIGWWSISNALTGIVQSVASLKCFRFMLGLGEAGAFTVAPKVVSEWFPPKERGLAIGIYSVGGAVGATVAPLMILLFTSRFGWRWTFAVSPVLAGLWLLVWVWLYRKPLNHPNMTDKERDYLAAHLAPVAAPTVADEPKASELALWGAVIRQPRVWTLMMARLLTDPVWYFYLFWMAKYFSDARGVAQQDLTMMWKIFLAADVGFLLGGFLSGRVIALGATPAASRLWVMLSGACLVPLFGLIPNCSQMFWVIAISMIVAYAHTSWLSNLTALVVDTIPSRILGTSFGLIACGSTLGGIFMNQLVAYFVKNYDYSYCFYAMAFVHPVAWLLLFLTGVHRQGASKQ